MLENTKCDTPNSRARSAINSMKQGISQTFKAYAERPKKKLTIPCLSSLSARAPNPGNAKATKTAAIPPCPSASKICLIVCGLSRSPCTNSNNASTGSVVHFRLSNALEADALALRVRARMRKLECKKREETTARPCRPVAPTMRTVFGGLVNLLPERLVDIWKRG